MNLNIPKLKNALIIIGSVGIIITFALISILDNSNQRIGGQAINGYEENGKYYVQTEDNNYVEVKEADWWTNIILFIVTVVFAIIFGLLICFLIAYYYIWPKIRDII